MVKVTEQDYYMDGILKENLDTAKEAIKKDWDMVFLYDGIEGSGKSVKALQDAYYCDPTLTIDRITFKPKEFENAVLAADKFQSVVYDEAYSGLSSRSTMSRINRTLVKMLAEIRQKNLFVFVVMPTFFDLDKYVALWRSRALVHVYTKGFQRGFFMFFSAEKKKDLYIQGKKYYNYGSPSANFHGCFTKHYVVNEEAYKEKKLTALMQREEESSEEQIKKDLDKELFIRVSMMTNITNKTKSQILGITEQCYYQRIRKMNEQAESNPEIEENATI